MSSKEEQTLLSNINALIAAVVELTNKIKEPKWGRKCGQEGQIGRRMRRVETTRTRTGIATLAQFVLKCILEYAQRRATVKMPPSHA